MWFTLLEHNLHKTAMLNCLQSNFWMQKVCSNIFLSISLWNSLQHTSLFYLPKQASNVTATVKLYFSHYISNWIHYDTLSNTYFDFPFFSFPLLGRVSSTPATWISTPTSSSLKDNKAEQQYEMQFIWKLKRYIIFLKQCKYQV